MKHRAFQKVGLGVAIGAAMLCRIAEAGDSTPIRAAACTTGLENHPVFCVVVHVCFLCLLLGVGSTVVSVLFKSPFQS